MCILSTRQSITYAIRHGVVVEVNAPREVATPAYLTLTLFLRACVVWYKESLTQYRAPLCVSEGWVRVDSVHYMWPEERRVSAGGQWSEKEKNKRRDPGSERHETDK